VGIPKTIDNDLPGTDQTIGFSTCVDVVTEAVERLRSTAESHDRIMVLEVMGRDSGYVALHGGLAGGAQAILIPEVEYDTDQLALFFEKRREAGYNYSVVVVSEGAIEKKSAKNLHTGSVGSYVGKLLEEKTAMETRVTVLGHLQRGGSPNATDRILAAQFAVHAVDLVADKKFGRIVIKKDGVIADMKYKSIARWQKKADYSNQYDPSNSKTNWDLFW
jgi:6-phosphofructokinase